ncbi:hypothetical protein HanXRQr2_Chr07g0285861 [Helianthus annuus]|uniref:Uncharacterized protein n=1 Tax=Helianthus annuus TaxID=4232 RepID=A0A9K3IK75_HELAN|nr:hypothetical protein HanXRQr2_Chr07g0285861 [Helianthus annuus]KAJ0904001.1 hypothetical protein HanPSC8_Chr07g0276721 [Helianthus annuus]
MKNSAAKLDNNKIPPKLAHDRPLLGFYHEGTGVVTEGGIRAMPLVQAKEVFC